MICQLRTIWAIVLLTPSQICMDAPGPIGDMSLCWERAARSSLFRPC